jgi:hypothetical protein
LLQVAESVEHVRRGEGCAVEPALERELGVSRLEGRKLTVRQLLAAQVLEAIVEPSG